MEDGKDVKRALRDVLQAKLTTKPSVVLHSVDESEDEHDKETPSVPLEERRVRNRLAARKCREKRKQRIWNLEKICLSLEEHISTLQNEIVGLDNQKDNLMKLLDSHECVRLVNPSPVTK